MSFRDDGDALLARNDALAAENARLQAENARLRGGDTASQVQAQRQDLVPAPERPRRNWKKLGVSAVLYGIAIAVAIAQGIIPL